MAAESESHQGPAVNAEPVAAPPPPSFPFQYVPGAILKELYTSHDGEVPPGVVAFYKGKVPPHVMSVYRNAMPLSAPVASGIIASSSKAPAVAPEPPVPTSKVVAAPGQVPAWTRRYDATPLRKDTPSALQRQLLVFDGSDARSPHDASKCNHGKVEAGKDGLGARDIVRYCPNGISEKCTGDPQNMLLWCRMEGCDWVGCRKCWNVLFPKGQSRAGYSDTDIHRRLGANLEGRAKRAEYDRLLRGFEHKKFLK